MACGRQKVKGGHGSNIASSRDRKSTRLNSSHGYISYAVFCLKKKKTENCCGQGGQAAGSFGTVRAAGRGGASGGGVQTRLRRRGSACRRLRAIPCVPTLLRL